MKISRERCNRIFKVYAKRICIIMFIVIISSLMLKREETDIFAAQEKCLIVLSKYSAKMDIGGQMQLIAFTSDGKKPSFKSSKAKVASVNNYGLITAKSSGTATITVSRGKSKAVCKITVNQTEIRVEDTSVEMQKGDKRKINVFVSSGTNPTFRSSNSRVVKVDTAGNMTAVKNGSATITIRADGETKKCKVTVKKPQITLDSYEINMTVGDKKALGAKVSNGCQPEFRSSNSKVAGVDSNGMVTACKKGKAVITVSEDGTKAKCKIVVTE
ncbi:MAG: Ig-like domain-containing protein [Lachnospiraceae bacterium]|nr:Ig-like domain-containing protein [Lachnospiraceae bacterium]